MKLRTIVLLLGCAVTAAFLAVNWRALAIPMHVSLFAYSTDLPIRMVIAGPLALMLITMAVYVAMWKATYHSESRRQRRELQAHRALAEDAEASRFTQLREFIAAELAQLGGQLGSAIEEFRRDLQDTEHSLAATLGEMDDRLRRESAAALKSD